MPNRLSLEQRSELANRLNGGQPPAGIATDMNISVKTVYRLKHQFEHEEGNFEAVPPETAPNVRSRETSSSRSQSGCTTSPSSLSLRSETGWSAKGSTLV